MCGNVVRNEVIKKHPELSNIFKKLSGLITDQDMAQMNYEVKRIVKNQEMLLKTFYKRRIF